MSYEYAKVYTSTRFRERYTNSYAFLYDAFMSLENAYGYPIILLAHHQSYLISSIERTGLTTMHYDNNNVWLYSAPENTLILALSTPSDELHKNRHIRKLKLQGYTIEHVVIQPFDNEEYADLLKGGLL